jgi:hypothetical protein
MRWRSLAEFEEEERAENTEKITHGDTETRRSTEGEAPSTAPQARIMGMEIRR